MKLMSEASIKILEYAQKREKESLDFYSDCLTKATIDGTKKILHGLVDDEHKHYTIVTNLLKEAKGDSSIRNVKTGKIENAKTRIEIAFPHKIVNDKEFSAESATVGEMLDKALENEKESFENYSRAAAETEEDEVKAIYTYLAQQENIHYVLVDNLIDYLSDPGKWLYQEENLIFRL